ncbi:MAG: 5'-nucleotidase C-terminal domain-containing protein [Treponemataceae bacterium]|nr:5'-nucleotidase C-terminal domain-containing protein [Treponemataceae bacterium]
MKKAGKIAALIVAIAFIFSSVAFAASGSKVIRDPDTVYTLKIMHTNDHHGATLSKDGKYGLAERATYIKSVREEGGNILLLDAGDINTGSALSNMFHAEPDIMAYNLMGYEAAAFGNHEFDSDLDVLLNQMEIADYPFVCANIVDEDGDYLGRPYIIKDYVGFRVGIFGLTTLRTLTIASPDASLTFIDEIEAAADMVDLLRNEKNCDIVILLGHLGDVLETADQNTSIKVAEAVDGIDLIVDGHSHSFMTEPVCANGTYIVSSNEWGKYVGTGTLSIKNGKLIGFEWAPVEITSEAFPADAEVLAMLDPYIQESNASLKEVVLKTTAAFDAGNKWSRKWETPIGDLVADALVGYVRNHGVSVDFGFTNGGNIRASLPAGDVTRENIMTVLPFENYVYVITLTGEDMIDFANFIPTLNQGAGGFLQMSKEVSYTLEFDDNGNNGRISDVLINGEPIDPSATYRMVTNDYLSNGGDGYTVLTRSIDTYNTSMLMSDAVVEYAQSLGAPLSPVTDGRITVIGGVKD